MGDRGLGGPDGNDRNRVLRQRALERIAHRAALVALEWVPWVEHEHGTSQPRIAYGDRGQLSRVRRIEKARDIHNEPWSSSRGGHRARSTSTTTARWPIEMEAQWLERVSRDRDLARERPQRARREVAALARRSRTRLETAAGVEAAIEPVVPEQEIDDLLDQVGSTGSTATGCWERCLLRAQ